MGYDLTQKNHNLKKKPKKQVTMLRVEIMTLISLWDMILG
jgi:hypothetical protein